MKYAVLAPTAANTTATPESFTEFTQHVEACGFESSVAVEHALVMSRYSRMYPYDKSGNMELADDCSRVSEWVWIKE